MSATKTIVKINVYHDADGAWHYSAWSREGHDHNGTIDDAESATEAIEWASREWPGADVREVDAVA